MRLEKKRLELMDYMEKEAIAGIHHFSAKDREPKNRMEIKNTLERWAAIKDEDWQKQHDTTCLDCNSPCQISVGARLWFGSPDAKGTCEACRRTHYWMEVRRELGRLRATLEKQQADDSKGQERRVQYTTSRIAALTAAEDVLKAEFFQKFEIRLAEHHLRFFPQNYTEQPKENGGEDIISRLRRAGLLDAKEEVA